MKTLKVYHSPYRVTAYEPEEVESEFQSAVSVFAGFFLIIVLLFI